VTRLVILDRDGVINADSPDYIKSPDEWRPLPGSLEAIARLGRAGYQVVVASNQSGLGRGLFDAATLEAIHEKMRQAVAEAGGSLRAIYFCPHRPEENCDCRKPRPGLFHQIEKDLGTSLVGVPAIGDSARDMQAARAVGARPILVLTGNGQSTRRSDAAPSEIFDDLASAADLLVKEPA
jgi:D-glycero-D-manno-heptose 1,7-bisphosphate phosphatase